MRVIPVNQPLFIGNEARYLQQCIESGWISSEGPFVRRFEEQFSQRIGRKFGVAVSNGTAAIDIAIETLGIGPGDEVILPSFTIISCVLQIVRCGAIPILVDSDLSTWNMDVSEVESKITRRTKAIMVVHIYGLPTEMDEILSLCAKYNLKLIEDAAEVIGQTYRGRECGSFGDISTVSFYPNKHVTTGEGGMVLTNDECLKDTAEELRNLCFKANKRFIHDRLGWNYRMTSLQAAVGMAQLEQLEHTITKKRQIGNWYRERLEGIAQLQLPLAETSYSRNIYWVYGILIRPDLSITAEQLMLALGSKGVMCRPFFYPLHLQPVLREKGFFLNEQHPRSEYMYRKGLYLPSGVALTEDDVTFVVQSLREILNK